MQRLRAPTISAGTIVKDSETKSTGKLMPHRARVRLPIMLAWNTNRALSSAPVAVNVGSQVEKR